MSRNPGDASRHVALVPDLPVERWLSMDRYALRLFHGLNDENMRGWSKELVIDVESMVSSAGSGERGAGSGKREAFSATTRGQLKRYYQRYFRYPKLVSRRRADLFHVLDHSYGHVCSRLNKPSVLTVHDLFFDMEQAGGFGPRHWLKSSAIRTVAKGIRAASAYIVATGYMKDQLARFLDSSHNIFIAPYGVEKDFTPSDEELRAKSRKAFGLADSQLVVLHVGSNAPRKNLSCVVDTVDLLRTGGIECSLLQVGAPPREESARSWEFWAGQVDDAKLRTAYHAADVLLFPSHYEGFGLPVIEAMASGLPVVASGAGGMEEVGGKAAVIIPNGTAEDYARRIDELWTEPNHLESLREKGLERAREFSWQQTASLTADVYHKVLD